MHAQASFLVEIVNEDDHELALMDELIEDYDNQQVLIELLSHSIEPWENSSADFTEFNQRISRDDPDVSTLRELMDQHNLKVADLPEIGSKSLVSKILNQKGRQLNPATYRGAQSALQCQPRFMLFRPSGS